MKHLKHVVASALAVLMALVLATPAFAAAADGSVSVTGLATGDKVSYYQVLVEDETTSTGWQLTSDYASLIDSTVFVSAEEGAGKTDAQKKEIVVNKILNGITQEQANAIAGKASTKAGEDKTLAETDKGTWSAEVNPGLYMAIVAAKDAGVVYNPAFVGNDYKAGGNTIAITERYEQNGIAKKETVTVTKTAQDTDDAWKQGVDSLTGTDVPFKITTTIPVFLDSYKNPSFKITDAVSAGLEINTDSVKVKYGETETAIGATDANLTTFSATKSSITVDFASTYLDANTSAVPVEITYTAKVVNPAELNVNYDHNDVTVEYSNGPNNEKGAIKDVTNHYTFSIGAKVSADGQETNIWKELRKVALDDNGNIVWEEEIVGEETKQVKASPLANATFTLYSDENCTTVVTNKNHPAPTGATCTTGDDGIIKFYGLDAGTYYMKETAAPDGYVKNNTTYRIEIIPEYEDKEITETVEGVEYKYTTRQLKSYTIKVNNNVVASETYTLDTQHANSTNPEVNYNPATVNIVNDKGNELPSTGGMGTTILYTIGGLMIAAGGVALITKKRLSGIEG